MKKMFVLFTSKYSVYTDKSLAGSLNTHWLQMTRDRCLQQTLDINVL